MRTAVTASDWVRPCTDGTVAVAPGPSRKNHAVRAAMSTAAATAGHQRRRRRPPPSATTRPSSGGGGRVMATVSDRGRVATPPAARSDAGCEPCTGSAVVEVGWAAAAAAATPAGRASRAPAGRVARVRRTQGEELPGVGGPVVGVARRGDGDEVVERRRQAGDPARRRGHPAVHVLVGDVDGGVAGERLAAGEHLEEHQPGRVDVAAGVGDAALDLLGREVGDGAQQHALGARDGLAGHGPGQAEVGDLDGAVVVDDDVLGLDVAVDQALGVGLGERAQHRLQHVERGPRRKQPLLAHDVAQGLAGHVLHRQEDAAVVLALVVDGDDVGVRERRARAGLAAEPGDEALVVGEVLAHHLQGDLAVEPLVDGQVHRRHPAVGDPTEHAVAPVEGAPDERVAGG